MSCVKNRTARELCISAEFAGGLSPSLAFIKSQSLVSWWFFALFAKRWTLFRLSRFRAAAI